MLKFIKECLIMFKRQNLLMMQNPDAIFVAIIVPSLIMLLFVFVFGGAMDVGSYEYVNFITFAIILQASMQASSITAISVSKDMTTGMIERFRSMPISKVSFIIGHVFAGTLRNVISALLMLVVAFIIGFRPTAGYVEWIYILGIIFLFMLMLSWISAFIGVLVKSQEAASGIPALLAVLPYLSSGFVPIESLASGLQPFARVQPLTPIVDTLRGVSLGGDIGNTWVIAVIWCVSLIVFFKFLTFAVYTRKLAV